MRKLILFLSLIAFLCADTLEVRDFRSDLYSKATSELQKVEVTLIFDGRDMKANRNKIFDALNIVIGSFFFEDLMTSKGKERFKTLLIKYLDKKYGVDTDDIMIIKMLRVDNITVKNLIKELKKEGCCKK